MHSLKKTCSSKTNQNDSVFDVRSSSLQLKSKMSDLNHESDNGTTYFPCINVTDNAQNVPKLSAVLGRPVEEGVGMEDLDQLQQDLEKLLSTCVVRYRLLNCEMESVDKDRSEDKKDKKYFDKVAYKRRRQEEKPKSRDTKNAVRIVKRKHFSYPVNNSVIVASNVCDETSDRFWLFVEQYCGETSRDDVAYLDDLLTECAQDVDVKVPDLGEYYVNKWIDDTEFESCLPNGKTKEDIRKAVMASVMDIFSDPLAQRQVNGLIEEKILPKLPEITTNKIKLSQKSLAKISGASYPNLCMVLVDQGIIKISTTIKIKLNLQDLTSEDEILQKIKRCQQDLAIVNEHNYEELVRLRKTLHKDQKRQHIKAQLVEIDTKIQDIYGKIMSLKQEEQEDGLYFKQHQSLKDTLAVMERQLALNKDYTALSNETDYSTNMQ